MASGPIQTGLPGFLSLLSLKNQGQRPEVLSDTVLPVVDVTKWYALDAMECHSGDVTVLSNFKTALVFTFTGGDLATAVPSNEIWYVHEFTPFLTVNAVNTTAVNLQQFAAVRLLRQTTPAGRGILRGPGMRYDGTGLSPLTLGWTIRGESLVDFWMPPGSQLGFELVGLLTDAVADCLGGGIATVTKLQV